MVEDTVITAAALAVEDVVRSCVMRKTCIWTWDLHVFKTIMIKVTYLTIELRVAAVASFVTTHKGDGFNSLIITIEVKPRFAYAVRY